MKNAIRSVLAAAAMAVVSTVHGAALPRVGAGTELNTWTRNFSGVLAAAKTTGHPILLIMVNNSSSGDGCSHCKMFEERTLNSAAFDAIVKDYKFYMVLLNYWGIDQGSTQPEYGGVPYSVFWPIFQTYNADGGFPVVSVIERQFDLRPTALMHGMSPLNALASAESVGGYLEVHGSLRGIAVILVVNVKQRNIADVHPETECSLIAVGG